MDKQLIDWTKPIELINSLIEHVADSRCLYIFPDDREFCNLVICKGSAGVEWLEEVNVFGKCKFDGHNYIVRNVPEKRFVFLNVYEKFVAAHKSEEVARRACDSTRDCHGTQKVEITITPRKVETPQAKVVEEDNRGEDAEVRYLHINVEMCRSAAKDLSTAFIWSSTAEGAKYWGAIQKRLHSIADKAEEEKRNA